MAKKSLEELTEAKAVGAADGNESIPAEQRVVTPSADVQLSEGPLKDAKTLGHLPASYRTNSGNVRHDR